MNQLCYLSSPGQEHRYDELFRELDIVVTTFSTVNVQSLVAFVLREKLLFQMDYFLCDLTGDPYSPEHVLNAVQQLSRYSKARLIFIAPASEDTAILFGRMADGYQISDLIEVTDSTDIVTEVKSCLLGEPSFARRVKAIQTGLSAAAVKRIRPLDIPLGLVCSVRVGGSMPRVGTTTQAFALYHYMKGLGFHPALLDPENRTTSILLDLYPEDVQEKEGYTEIRGIPFCSTERGEFDAYITDMGVLREEYVGQFTSADLCVLVGGAKPWELPPLANALNWLKRSPLCRESATLISFAAQNDLDHVKGYLGAHWNAVSYHPDPWEPPGNTAAYQSAILPCLKNICGDRS